MASDKIEVAVQVVKIEPAGKYVLTFPRMLSREQEARLRDEWLRFMASPNGGVFVIDGGARIMRIDNAGDDDANAGDEKSLGS